MENIKGDICQLIVFKQGGQEYAILVEAIKEVVLTPRITKMPEMLPHVKGISNIRGNIITIVNLEEKFNLERTIDVGGENDKNFTLIIENEDKRFGILVKEVPGTLTVSKSTITDNFSMESGDNIEKDYLKGIVRMKDRLVILIDILKVFEVREQKPVSSLVN
ncbi:MAG: chemotaxis protein CheW [Cyclobacteriaceae bacterium]|nr:chemotaxis protein CheW [Cyclobacteriaceae bacterium]